MVIQAEEQQSRMEKLKIKADSALLMNSPRSTLERRGKSTILLLLFFFFFFEWVKKKKKKDNKNYEKKNFRFWREFKVKGKFEERFNQEWSSRKATSWMPRFRTKCAKRRQGGKTEMQRSCATAMGVLERATGFLLLSSQLVQRREGKDLDFVVDQKEEEDKEEWDKSREAKRRGSQWRTISCISSLKEEEDDVVTFNGFWTSLGGCSGVIALNSPLMIAVVAMRAMINRRISTLRSFLHHRQGFLYYKQRCECCIIFLFATSSG